MHHMQSSPILLWLGAQVALTTPLCSSMHIVIVKIKTPKRSFAKIRIVCSYIEKIYAIYTTIYGIAI